MENAATGFPLPFLIDVASSISQRPHGGSGVAFSCIFVGTLKLPFFEYHCSKIYGRLQEEIPTSVVDSDLFRRDVSEKLFFSEHCVTP
jgi:hypothetical protein